MDIKDIKLTDDNIKVILKYFTSNTSQFKETFYKLKQYCVYFKFINLTDKDILFMKNIPMIDNYKLKLPVKIFRGIRVSDEMFKQLKSKKPKYYKPLRLQNYSSWTFDAMVAANFSFGYNRGVIFESIISNKKSFIDIRKYQIICYNLKNYLLGKSINKTKLENIILDLISFPIIDEEEILVFGKIKINKTNLL